MKRPCFSGVFVVSSFGLAEVKSRDAGHVSFSARIRGATVGTMRAYSLFVDGAVPGQKADTTVAKQVKKSPLQMIKAYLGSLSDLDAQRRFLVTESHSSAFPGSEAAELALEVRGMLAAFDLAHPDIAAAIKAERDATSIARLDGRDILGM